VILERGAEVRTGEEVAVRTFERVLDQVLRSLRIRDSGVELRDLSPGRSSPARGRQQPTDLRKCEAGVLVEAMSATRSAVAAG
jgi:hypothetical protein